MTDEANKNKANYVASNETLKTAIANTYTLNSFERFIGEFYTFWAIRDNLCRTKLVSDVSETNNKSFNYFIMAPSDGSEYQPVFFQLNRYKTDKTYGSHQRPLPLSLSNQFRVMYKKKRIPDYFAQSKEYVFGEPPLTAKITKIFLDAGIPEMGIDQLRSSYVTYSFETGDPDFIAQTALYMGHSVAVAEKIYLRRFDANSAPNLPNQRSSSSSSSSSSLLPSSKCCKEGEKCCCCCVKK
jgi:hypothetical protein